MKQLKRRSGSQLTKNPWWGSYINMANSADEKVDGTWSIRIKIQSIDMTMIPYIMISLSSSFSLCHGQGWGRLQKPDHDYDYDYSAHKIIDYDYDYSGN